MNPSKISSGPARLAAAATALAALTALAVAAIVPATADEAATAEIDRLVAEASVEDGAAIARICGNCHTFQPGAGNKIGPNLYDVFGRPVAGAPGYPYSPALSGQGGKAWDNALLDAFLADPNAWAPGTKMSFPGLKTPKERAAVIAWLRGLTETQAQSAPPRDRPVAVAEPEIDKATWRLQREGLVIELSAKPVGEAAHAESLLAGAHAEIAFSITDEATGEPVRGLFPGAWMDVALPWGTTEESSLGCKDRAGLYLQGQGFKPMIDMNSYYMMVLNREPSILVFDPLVNVSGSTMLYAQINLKEPGADWVKSLDDRWFFVSMPRANQIAVVDNNFFKVVRNVDAGVHPVRVAVQPDGRYLWVGNDSREPAESGVTVIDLESMKTVAQIPTGAGHHEIAFADDGRTAYVSNRKDGTVSVIDIQTLAKKADIETGRSPISMAVSPLSKSLYVADGATGEIAVIDTASEAAVTHIQVLRGLGPLRFDQTGRWGFAVNTANDLVYIIDASNNRVAHEIAVGMRPYQVAFSRSFAYVRSLGTERVSMINMQELEKGRKPPVVTFAVGDKAPEEAPELKLADALVEAPGEAAVLVASPGDATVYYYMEGMNAPMGAFRNYGYQPLAVEVVDRALREGKPGVYKADVKLGDPGVYEIAFIMDAPQILHCFRMVAKPNPDLRDDRVRLAVEFLLDQTRVPAGEPMAMRFQLTDPVTGQLQRGLDDVRVLVYRAPGQYRTEIAASEVSDGIYEAELPMKFPGSYFVHVSSASKRVPFGQLPYATLRAVTMPAGKERTGG